MGITEVVFDRWAKQATVCIAESKTPEILLILRLLRATK